VNVQWLSGCLVLLTALSSCAGTAHERERPQVTSSASARRARMARAEARKQAALEQAAAQEEAERAEHPLARAVAAQDRAAQGGLDAPKSKLANDAEPRTDKREKHVAVQGIEGTLSNFDVRVTMEKQSKAFAKCHEPRARKVKVLAGGVEFRIHVLQSGEVSAVDVRVSDLGDRVLERCMSEVIASAKFPEPHGGEADVTWNMALEQARGRPPEQWEEERIERVLKKRGGELLETCDAERAGPITVTAYVSKRGKVLAAGAAATKSSSQEHLDCIADELRSWDMPKPRKGVAKVSFPLRS
jgi:hypothetical protein